MTTVSNFVVVRNESVTLSMNGFSSHTDNFEVGSNLIDDRQPVLTLQLKVSNPTDLAWDCVINGTEVFSFTHDTSQFGAIQETCPTGILKVGTNDLTIAVRGGDGEISTSDMVVLHKVDA